MKLPAVAREALIGFPKNHTLKLDSEMVRKTVVDAEGDGQLTNLINEWKVLSTPHICVNQSQK